MDRASAGLLTSSSIALKSGRPQESPQPWTATRCHRILRPLQTHITALRKEVKRGCLPCPNQASKQQQGLVRKRSCPDLAALEASKRVRRRYSNHCSTKRVVCGKDQGERHVEPTHPARRKSRRAGEMALATPILRRVRNHEPSPPLRVKEIGRESESESEPSQQSSRCYHSARSCGTRCTFEAQLASLRARIGATLFPLHESIFRALDALLRATSPERNASASPRSLMAMCLRKVPDCIAALECWEQEEAEGNGTKSALGSTVSLEMYSELESIGAGHGWKHLCTIVRSDGIRMVRDAVAEGLVHLRYAGLLVDLCAEYMPIAQVEPLIDSFTVRQYPTPLGLDDSMSESQALMPIVILHEREPKGSAISLLSGKMSTLLSAGLLPARWILVPDFGKLWACVAESIGQRKTFDAEFLITCISQLALLTPSNKQRIADPGRYEAVQKATIASIATLVSLVLLGEEAMQEKALDGNGTTVNVRKRVEYIIHCSIALAHGRKRESQQQGRMTYLLHLATYFASTTSAAASIEERWKALEGRADTAIWSGYYHLTVLLISSIAYFWSRGGIFPAQTCYTRLCDRLGALNLPSRLLRNVRTEGAFYLAERTGDLRDLVFAESLKTKSRWQDTTLETATKPSTFAGFRWDDGISEWINVSPVGSFESSVRATSRSLRSARRGETGTQTGCRSFRLARQVVSEYPGTAISSRGGREKCNRHEKGTVRHSAGRYTDDVTAREAASWINDELAGEEYSRLTCIGSVALGRSGTVKAVGRRRSMPRAGRMSSGWVRGECSEDELSVPLL